MRAAEYPPQGERALRGLAPLQYAPCRRASLHGTQRHDGVVQFEVPRDRRAEEIFAVDGVDMALFGTNELTADLGIPGDYDHPKVRDAYARAIAAAKKHRKHVGVGGLGGRPKLTADFVRMGARYVSTGTDLGFLLAAATEQASRGGVWKPTARHGTASSLSFPPAIHHGGHQHKLLLPAA